MESEARDELVGRDTERDRLRRMVERLASGIGGAVLVTGPAGIGKSALMNDLAAHVRTERISSEIAVARVRAVASERGWPYSGLHLMLSGCPEDVLPDDGHARALAWVQRLVSGGVDGATSYEVGRRVLEGVNQVSAPTVVLVDDAHLLDPRSQEVLGFVARRLRHVPVAVLLAADSSAEVAAFNGLAVLGLEELSAGDAVQLVQRAGHVNTAPRVAAEIARRVGGNPRALLDVAAQIPEPQLTGHIDLDRYLPRSGVLHEWLGREITQLDEVQRHALLVAAVSDDGRLAPVLEALDADDSLVKWLTTSYMAVSEGTFALRPPSVDSVVWQGSSYAARARAHSALAAVYAGKDEDQHLWHQAQAAHDEDDELAAGLERMSRTLMARGELERSLARAREAVRLSPYTAQRVDRLVLVGGLALMTGRLEEVTHLAQERFRLDTTITQRADLALLEARARNLLDGEVAAGLVTRHVEEVADVDPNRAALLNLCAATGFARRMEPAEANRFLVLAERCAEYFDAATADTFQCVAASLAASRGDLERAVELVGSAPAVGDPFGAAERRICRSKVLARAERFDQAREQLRAVVLDERLAESPLLLAEAHSALVELEVRAGRLPAAGDAASAWDRVASWGYWRAVVPASMIRVHRLLGEYEMAWERRRESAERSRRQGDWWARALLQSETGALLLALGRLEEAISVLEHARRYALEHSDPSILAVEPDYIEACARNGELARAWAALTEFEQRALKVPTAWAQHTLARCHALASEGEESVALFRAAVDVHADTVSPVELSRTVLCFGERLRRLGRRVEAAEWFHRAIVMAQECGALSLATRAEEELRASGRSTTTEAVAAAELTEAEQRVASLVAAGRRNREIAAELFVSVRTVEAHLGRIFRKLGVRSRTELASLVASRVD